MNARINEKVEKALRQVIGAVPRAEADQILAPLATLADAERVEAIGLSITVTCYVMVDACGGQWPDDANVRQLAHGITTVSPTAERLGLDAAEVYAYLSRTVLGPEPLDGVIPDRAKAERLAVIVAHQAIVVYSAKNLSIWDYLDQIESAIEVASALDATVLPAAVMRAYLPKPTAEGA